MEAKIWPPDFVRNSVVILFFTQVSTKVFPWTVFFSTLLPGVLQRFFISYLVVGGLHAFFQARPEGSSGKFVDIIPYWPQWAIVGALELIWILITYLLRWDNCPAGYIGPGGLHENSKYWNCTGGAAGYIDNKFFGDAHIFQHVTSREVYFHDQYYFGGQIRHHDPCGILGSINSIVVVFLGLQEMVWFCGLFLCLPVFSEAQDVCTKFVPIFFSNDELQLSF